MDINYQLYNPEIWGGLECTINRIGDSFRDQLIYAGHYNREDDIEKIAQLGIKKLRYPILWEAHQTHSKDDIIRWKKTREQLHKIRSNNMVPIAGLLHHGSGPSFTGLINDDFPELLAGYASKVAREFPWIGYYTPINEPLTTARFSGLYGYWFPHHKNAFSFSKILLNQLKGIVFSMKEVRKINPAAKLVQTEDLAKIHSTPEMKYQADFENERRWLTYDILSGKLNQRHFFWNYFISLGIDTSLLQFFLDNPCVPDIAGFNYYVTSERYLDQKTQLYPESSHGGNGKDIYADVAAVRAIKPSGLKSLLREAWQRFHFPMALTEVHMNCTREEQLRWFKEAWDNCCELNKEGVNMEAITAWSLLGAFDWSSLLTREEKNYETGVYEIIKNTLRPTAVAKLIHSLVETGNYKHPVLNEKGWWHKSYPGNKNIISHIPESLVLIFGSTGTLGTAFTKICQRRSIQYCAFAHSDVDIFKIEQIEQAIDKYKPWAIINASGYVKVDEAENEQEICFELNAKAPGALATICKSHGIQLITFSSDLVFDGEKKSPYIELDSVKPLNIYGESKAKGESNVIQNYSDSLIIRTSSFFGPWDEYNFAYELINSLKENKKYFVVKDVIVSPTYVPHLVDKALDLLIDEEKGIWHLTNDGMLTWCDFAEEVALRGGYNNKNIIPRLQTEMKWKAKRPVYSALESEKGIKLPSLQSAINQYFEEKIN
ncbi:MAG: family 1 glycosylhydrolase [Ginsengibacter sp.]